MAWYRCMGSGKVIYIDMLIPRMTSDTTPSGTCSASYVYPGRYAYYGFTTNNNGNITKATDFWYKAPDSQEYLQYDFDNPVTVYRVGFGTIQNQYVGNVLIQYSTDDITWNDFDTLNVVSGAYTTYTLSIPIVCKAIRLKCLTTNEFALSGVQAWGFVDS